MEKLDAQVLCKRVEKAFSSTERANAESIWELISEFILPNQHGLFAGQEARGGKRTGRLFDSTAIQANHDLASAINATLTNTATRWVKFKYTDPALHEDEEANMWIQSAEEKFHQALSASNFANEVAKGYKSFTGLGTMLLMHEEKDLDDSGQFSGFNFKAFHLAEVAFSENILGRVDTIYRKFKLTARQAESRWGNKLPEAITESLREDPEKEFNFYHCIFPRSDKEIKINEVGRAAPKHRPYASIYIYKDGSSSSQGSEIVEEGGYYEFPCHVARWETMPGEVYGRGPGHIALPDVRTLNKAKELGLHAIAKAINPPILAEQRSVLSALDLRPGQVSVVKNIEGIREMVTQTRFDVTQFAVEDLRNSIRNIFFLDKLFLPDRTEIGEMTAFETARRVEELQRVLGPTLGRLDSELLDPISARGFDMMLRGGAFGRIPDIVRERGAGIDVEYVNALARSQKVEDLQAIQNAAQSAALLAQLGITEAIDPIDPDGAMRVVFNITGTPEQAIRSQKAVDAIREQRAQMQQQAMALEAGVKAADIAAKSSQAGGGNNER